MKNTIKDIVYTDKNVLKGTPCFVGTRVSVATILEYLSLGWSISDLKNAYPTVKSEHISKLLNTLSSQFNTHAQTI